MTPSQHAIATPICRATLAVMALSASVGCQDKLLTSKWAMDDPDYSTKYSEHYGDTNKPLRMLKQAVDARHVTGKSGGYLRVFGSGDPTSVGAEIGSFEYQNPMIETRLGLTGLLGTGEKSWFLGVTPGIRLQTPTRLAPFVGVGGFVGGNYMETYAEDDNIDNDGNNAIDEDGEVEATGAFLGAITPEVGVHYWLNGTSRLTASGSYFLSSDGRNSDTWMLGLTFSMFYGTGARADEPPLNVTPDPLSESELTSSLQPTEAPAQVSVSSDE